MRILLAFSLSAALFTVACVRQTTPASRTCTVLTDESQLSQCVGKVVILHGTVTHNSPTQIEGVEVEAATELYNEVAYSRGKLERDSDGRYFLKQETGALAKAHSVKAKR